MFSHFPSMICNDYDKTSFCISNDYTVYSFGSSNFGSHGHEEKQINIPTQINNLTNIKMIDCGDIHTVFLTYDGDVFSFGNNEIGQLGIGKDKYEVKQSHIPQKINLPLCKQVSCGSNFTICLTDDNRLYSFGYNDYGKLGLGYENKKNYNSPQLVPDLNNIEYILCSGNHCICKTYNNEFYSWGYNYHGQLGQGNNKESCTKPSQCTNWPENIISIKSGCNHTLLLTSEGQVYSFGNNYQGQLGINDKNKRKINTPTLIKDIPEIQRIECGYDHSVSIDINDNLWFFGYNYKGQFGLGDNKNRFKPTIHPTLSNIMDISSRGEHTFVKTIDNKIYAFGYNCDSQLGITTSKLYQLTPIQVFIDNEDIWCSTIGKSRAKSARK